MLQDETLAQPLQTVSVQTGRVDMHVFVLMGTKEQQKDVKVCTTLNLIPVDFYIELGSNFTRFFYKKNSL